MRKWVKKTVPFAVAASLAFTALPDGAAAKGPGNGKGHGHGNSMKWEQKLSKKWKLKDVEKHWAEQTIQKMSLLGVIKGYEDMTFKPNKPVTHAEAVVMTIRLLGLEDKAEEQSTDNLSFRDSASIPVWARGSISLALEKGLIEDTHVFQANKAASRLYVTMLLVNAIGAEFDGDWQEAKTYFNDVENLDEKQRAYLAFAALTNLVNGYGDKSFKQNKPVTRAEMATLINRVLDKKEDEGDIDFDQSIEGQIESIDLDDDELVIKQENEEGDDENRTYTISDEVEVFIDGDEQELADLSTGMEVEFILDDDDEIFYIEAKSVVDEDADLTYKGEVAEIDDENNIIWVNVGLVKYPITITDSVEITADDEEANFDDFEVGQEVSFTLDSRGKVSVVSIEDEIDSDHDDASELLSSLGDLDKLSLTIDGDDDFQGNFEFERLDDNEFEAKIEVERDNEEDIELEDIDALEYLVDLVNEKNIQLEEGNVEIAELKSDLAAEFDIDDAQFDGEIVVAGDVYDIDSGDLIEEDITDLLNQLGDLEKLDVAIEGDNNFKLELFVELDDHENYEAEVDIENDENNEDYQATGKEALSYIVDLLAEESIVFDKDDVEIEELRQDLINRFNVENSEVEGTVVVDGNSYDVDGDLSLDEEEIDALTTLGNLENLDLQITGDNDTSLEFYFEVEDNDYSANISLVYDGNNFELKNKTALTYLATIVEEQGINLEEYNEDELNELVNDLIEKFNVENASVEGDITVKNEAIDFDDIVSL